MNRAYSVWTVKAIDEDARMITGIASTPTTDRVGDIVEPKGAEFKLPIPFLWMHDSSQPIGHVVKAKVTAAGIEAQVQLAKIDEPGALKDRLDEAWQSIKIGLVRGLSIGFKALEAAEIRDTWGMRITKWLWLELSAVTIPANQDASITAIKSIDSSILAASGRKERPVITLPASRGTQPKTPPKEGETVKTTSEQIAALEAKMAATVAEQKGVTTKSLEEGRNMDAAEAEKFDTLEAEIEAMQADIIRLKKVEAREVASAKAVTQQPTRTVEAGIGHNNPPVTVDIKQPDKIDSLDFVRLVKVKMASKLTGEPHLLMARKMYGENANVVGIVTKANEVVAGTTLTGNWAFDLVSPEGAAVAAFLEYLRPQTILGRFGTNGIPSLNRLDFYAPYVIETLGGAAYWVGEGKPKPLTAFNYDRSVMTPLKVANIAVLTEENIRYSSPNSDNLVRASLVKAIAAELDTSFIDPANSGTANAKPASITNGAETVVSTGDDEDDVRRDIRALFQQFINVNNAPTSGVWIMSATNALALGMMMNTLGQPAFPGIGMNGGMLQGLPVIVSQHIGSVVALVAADQIFLGDEGGVQVDMSREASIEMRSSGLGMDATAGTATVGSVSMFQTNSVALRAERTINWKRARASAVAYLTSVDWGGPVPPS